MPTFRDLYSLMKHIENNIEKTLPDVARLVEVKLRNYVMEHLYNASKPSQYQRTYQFITALTVGNIKKISNGYSVALYFDPKKIEPFEVKDSYWNQHMSIDGSTEYKGKSISEWLIEWIEYGEDSPKYSRDGIYMFENTFKEMEETRQHVIKMKNELRKLGFDVTIK